MNYKELKYIKKEIELLKDDFDELESAYLLSNKDKERRVKMFKYYVVHNNKEIIKMTSDVNSKIQLLKNKNNQCREFNNPNEALLWKNHFVKNNVNGEIYVDATKNVNISDQNN
jgi:hypothetical protein